MQFWHLNVKVTNSLILTSKMHLKRYPLGSYLWQMKIILYFDFLIFDIIYLSGLRKLALPNLKSGLKEMYRGVFISETVKELQKFIPSLKTCDVVRFTK